MSNWRTPTETPGGGLPPGARIIIIIITKEWVTIQVEQANGHSLGLQASTEYGTHTEREVI